MKDTTQHAFTKWFTICFWFLILKKKPKKHNHECKKTPYFSLFTLKKDFHKNIKSGMCAKFSKKHMQGNDNTEVLHSKQSVRTGELE